MQLLMSIPDKESTTPSDQSDVRIQQRCDIKQTNNYQACMFQRPVATDLNSAGLCVRITPSAMLRYVSVKFRIRQQTEWMGTIIYCASL